MTDTQIIELYWNRQEDAISATAAAYGSRLLGLSKSILTDPGDAQECVNDTYLRAWNAIPPEKPKRLFSFLACICRNLSFNRLDWQKAAKRKAEVVSLSEELEQCIPDAMAETHFQSQYLRNLLNTFLASLPEVDRLIFLRRYWYGEPVSQIAKQMHMGESNVKVRLFRIRGNLRDVLSKEGIAV